MPLSDVAEDLPVYTASILEDSADPDNYDEESNFQESGTVPVCVLELGGSEAFRLGLSVSTKLRRVFCDLVEGQAPFDEKARLAVRGETLNVLSVRAIDALDDSICIAETQVM